ncbi:hypothetical protein ACFO9Q_22200 [Paenibacillus sp. GCM10023252]|uniref:hypothetical protein n=1 Tax=Paenibacillus sp. GCM10023252 TaxID=3252649 RepID=UPI003623B58A
MLIMENGNRQYEVVEGFVKLPDTVKLGYTHGVVTDSEDRVYIFNMSKDAVVVLSPEGEYIRSWGEEYAAGAHGMLLHVENGREVLYLTDVARGLVTKTTLDGELLLTIGTPDLPEFYDESRRFVPTDVAVAANGDIYVADGYGQNMIHRYNAAGERIRSWGGHGSDPGQLTCPHGVSVIVRDGQEILYVADRGNNRIQVFTMDGEHVRFVTDEMDAPCSFFQFGQELYLPDLRSRVTILDAEDRLIAHLGENKEYAAAKGWPNLAREDVRPDQFSSPHGICVDRFGSIYVAEWVEYGRVTKLKRLS